MNIDAVRDLVARSTNVCLQYRFAHGEYILEQQFPTGGPKQGFRGSKMRFSRLRVYMILDIVSFKRTESYERLQMFSLKRTL